LAELLQSAHVVDGIVKGLKQPDWPSSGWQALHRLALQVCALCAGQTKAAPAGGSTPLRDRSETHVTDATPAQRHVQRHNQISIRLHYRLDADWHRLEARQWNERGFCFFHTHALQAGPVAFKRSLQHFEGEIVWTRTCQDKAQLTEMLLNEAIHRQADRLSSQPDMQQRLLRLMRVQGMVDAKQRVLASLGECRKTPSGSNKSSSACKKRCFNPECVWPPPCGPQW